MKIVACPGFVATLHIAKGSLRITQFKAVDLSGYTKSVLKHSNLQALLDAEFVEEYTGQQLPEKTNVKVEIPTVEQVIQSGEKNTQVKFTQTKDGKRINTQPDIPEGFSEHLNERAVADKEARQEELNKVEVNVGGVDDHISETNIKKLTAEDLKMPTVIDGKEVENFKFPAKPKRGKDNNTSTKTS